MSEQSPNYSKNPVLDVIEHIGHGLHVVFEDGKTIEQKLPEYLEATEVAIENAPTIVADTSRLIGAITGGAPILAAFESLGTNIADDVTAAQAIVTDFKTYWPNLKAAIAAELSALGRTESEIAAVFNPPAPAAPAA